MYAGAHARATLANHRLDVCRYRFHHQPGPKRNLQKSAIQTVWLQFLDRHRIALLVVQKVYSHPNIKAGNPCDFFSIRLSVCTFTVHESERADRQTSPSMVCLSAPIFPVSNNFILFPHYSAVIIINSHFLDFCFLHL